MTESPAPADPLEATGSPRSRPSGGAAAVVAVQLALAGVRDLVGVVTMIEAFGLLIRGVGTGRLIAAGAVIGLARWLLAPG